MVQYSLVSAFITDGTINPAGSGVLGSCPTMIVSARDSLQPSARVSCLVTGATGLVGNNGVRQLVNRNDNVRHGYCLGTADSFFEVLTNTVSEVLDKNNIFGA
jgi:hypothetical protein